MEAGGLYCEQHALELFAVLSMLDEMRHILDQTPVVPGLARATLKPSV